MAEGVTHISLPTQEYDRGRQEKTNRRTNTNKAWGYQEQREVCNTTCMCIPNSRYGLTLAWVTSENSTMLLESDILRLFFTGPFLSPRLSVPVSGVDCPSVDPRQLPLLLSNYQLCLLGRVVNSHSPPRTTSGYGEISCPRILCLVSRQNRQLNRLLWQPTPIVLQWGN